MRTFGKVVGIAFLLFMGWLYGWAASFVLDVWLVEPLRLTPVDARVIFGGMVVIFTAASVTCLVLAWHGARELSRDRRRAFDARVAELRGLSRCMRVHCQPCRCRDRHARGSRSRVRERAPTSAAEIAKKYAGGR